MGAPLGPSSNSKLQLLVEGNNDRHTIIHLMERHGITPSSQGGFPYVRACEGIHDMLTKQLPLVLKSDPTDRVIGVVLDADLSAGKRWNEVREKLETAKVECPETPVADGWISDHARRPRVGIWLMPDNRMDGTLEHFLEQMVPDTDRCWPFTRRVVAAAHRRGAGFAVQDCLKARLHTWLAWSSEPGIPYGLAVARSCFDTDASLALRFVDWFRRLFGNSTAPAGLTPPGPPAPIQPLP